MVESETVPIDETLGAVLTTKDIGAVAETKNGLRKFNPNELPMD